jgi:hypothetical protein
MQYEISGKLIVISFISFFSAMRCVHMAAFNEPYLINLLPSWEVDSLTSTSSHYENLIGRSKEVQFLRTLSTLSNSLMST